MVDKARNRYSAPPLYLQDEAIIELASSDDVIVLKAKSRVQCRQLFGRGS